MFIVLQLVIICILSKLVTQKRERKKEFYGAWVTD